MKKLRKGPELKMPQLKAPAFLADLYYDLRDRRLLPLVALVLVAIVAVPFLLGKKSEEPVVPPAAAAGAAEASGAKSSLTVVEATPGLRDYRKRLRHRAPTDPFEQRYTGPAGGGGTSSSGEGSSTSSETSSSSNAYSEEAVTTESSSTTVEVESGGGSSNGGGSGGGSNGSGSGGNSGGSGNGGKPHLIIYDYAIDARISYSPPAGPDGQPPEPFVEQRILPQTAIPGAKAPVVTYMGPGRNGDNKATGKVLLLVSGDVSSISGEHRCVSSRSGGLCQLLEVEPGFPLTFAYGDGGAHYTIKVLSIELVVTGHT